MRILAKGSPSGTSRLSLLGTFGSMSRYDDSLTQPAVERALFTPEERESGELIYKLKGVAGGVGGGMDGENG